MPPRVRAQGLVGAQGVARCGDVEDAPGHGGVASPLTGREVPEAAAEHGGAVRADLAAAELVGGTEGVADCRAQDRAAGPVCASLRPTCSVEVTTSSAA